MVGNIFSFAYLEFFSNEYYYLYNKETKVLKSNDVCFFQESFVTFLTWLCSSHYGHRQWSLTWMVQSSLLYPAAIFPCSQVLSLTLPSPDHCLCGTRCNGLFPRGLAHCHCPRETCLHIMSLTRITRSQVWGQPGEVPHSALGSFQSWEKLIPEKIFFFSPRGTLFLKARP